MKVPLIMQMMCIIVLKFSVCRYSCDTSCFHVPVHVLEEWWQGFFFLFYFLLASSKPEGSVLPEATLALLTWNGFIGISFNWNGSFWVIWLLSSEPRSCWYLWFLFFDLLEPSSSQSLRILCFPLDIPQHRALVSSLNSPPAHRAWSSSPGCAGMICSLAGNHWELEGSPDSWANLLFLTNTVCGSSREMRGDWGCKMQGERSEPAKKRGSLGVFNPGWCPWCTEVTPGLSWVISCSNHILQPNCSGDEPSASPRESQEFWGLLPVQLPGKGTPKLLQIICHWKIDWVSSPKTFCHLKWTLGEGKAHSLSLKLHVSTASQFKCFLMMIRFLLLKIQVEIG